MSLDRNPRCSVHEHPSWHRDGLHNYCDRCGTEVDLAGHDIDHLPMRGKRQYRPARRRASKAAMPETIRVWQHIAVGRRSECWLWTGHLKANGYATIHTNDDREVYAHRVVCELAFGPIPDGQQVDHLCRVRHCCNPYHLEPVTQAENNRRSNSISARHARKAYCIRGHELTEENLTGARKKGRQCKLCVRIVAREGYHRRKAAKVSAPEED